MTDILPTLYIIDVEKRIGSEFWSNRYLIKHTSFAEAQANWPDVIVDFERAFHTSPVLFTRVRLSTADPANDQYSIVPFNVSGQRNPGSTLLPLFNTLRVDIPASTGRPSRKYYRGVLSEGDIDGDLINLSPFGNVLTGLEALLGTPEGNGIVDPQGQLLANPVLHPYVQMRQLRRSRRRRSNGGGIFQP